MGHARIPSVSCLPRNQAGLVWNGNRLFLWRYGNQCFLILRKFDLHKELFMEIDCLPTILRKWKCFFLCFSPRFVYPKYKVSCCWSMSIDLFRIKQNNAELWKEIVTVTSVAVVTTSSYLTCAIARLIVMLARVIFRSCWGFYSCLDTHTCYRTCFRAWTALSPEMKTKPYEMLRRVFFCRENSLALTLAHIVVRTSWLPNRMVVAQHSHSPHPKWLHSKGLPCYNLRFFLL